MSGGTGGRARARQHIEALQAAIAEACAILECAQKRGLDWPDPRPDITRDESDRLYRVLRAVRGSPRRTTTT